MAEFSSFNGHTVKDTTARNIAKGRNQAVVYSNYADMIEALNTMDKEQFIAGQNIYIGTVGVPDLWVYSVEPIQHDFEYVSDEKVVELLENNITIQCGFYKVAMLEGQKVDLTTYEKKLQDLKHGYSVIQTENGTNGFMETFIPFETEYMDKMPTVVVSICGAYYADAGHVIVKNVLRTGFVVRAWVKDTSVIKSITINWIAIA